MIRSIQIETTSRCTLHCRTCLKPAFAGDWIERDMDRILFSRLLDLIPGTPTLHLQGWGEPLLHPDTISHIRKLKKSGFTVSFTTSGTIMDRNQAQSLILSGLDGITFSMAGGCRKTHDSLRGEHSFRRLQRSIETFSMTRDEFATRSPKIAVSYLLTPPSLPELPAVVSWCRRKKVDQLVTVFLTQAGCQEQQKLQFPFSDNFSKSFRKTVLSCQLRALVGNMQLRLKKFSPRLTPICDKDPRHNLFINAAGDVSPCVFLCPPISGEISWVYGAKKCQHPPLVFGNITKTLLTDIWNQQDYQSFRRIFSERAEYHDRQLTGISCSFDGSEKLETSVKDINSFFSSHPLPDHCLCCAKSDGF